MPFTFKDLLAESFKNLFNKADMEPVADEVFKILQTSYEKIGGLKGAGFSSPSDMVNSIPFWKLSYDGGKLVAVVMYKDTGGRKLVALGTDGSPAGKSRVSEILRVEFGRSYSELSGPILGIVKKHFTEIYNQYVIPSEEVSALIGKEVTPTGEYTYTRDFGGTQLEKELVGSPGKPIV